jgi:hypothetical protein
MKNTFTKIIASIAVILTLLPIQFSDAQEQRNPVLEFCTGTWCQWCPCGDDMILDNILPAIPNAIILAYHGAGSDPFRIFPGSSIIGSLGLSAYPTGVIDRVTGVRDWNTGWLPSMNSRFGVPATVNINVNRSYNKTTREFNASIDFTALENLSGQFSYNIILVEDSIIFGQTSNNTCTPGTTSLPNYVHFWLVRDMMNGVLGEEVINGTWNQGQIITKTFTHTVGIPAAPAPDIVPENCGIVVFIYKNGSPLNSNAEIQQAIQMILINPDYLATVSSTSSDVITENNSPAEYTIVLRNDGLLDDVYYVSASLDKTEWSGSFTTPNGTFSFEQIDSIEIFSGDSVTISVSVNPNSIDGFGITNVEFTSKGDPRISTSTSLRTVTTTGIDVLVIDASGENYGSAITGSLDNVYSGTYGIVSDEAVNNPDADLSTYQIVMWSSGDVVPVFTSDQVNALQDYLDQNGLLFINGQDIGADIFEAVGQSQFAQSFFNNYLHASYVANFGGSYFITGVAGDPIGDGFAFPLGASLYDRSPDQVAPYDTNATAVLKFSSSTNYAGIKADNKNYRIVYFAIGLEQIADAAIRDTVISRVITWLKEGVLVGVDDKDPAIAESFTLNQNYPNPFNPSTRISYSIAEDAQVSLKVYDIMGAEITELVNQKQSAGVYEIQFDASNLSSGMYFYKLSAGDFTSIKKMTLLK